MEQTLFWHDYETFGTDPQRDKPSQFAGVRTDLDFNIIEEPVCFYCKPPDDYLPQPEACVITGITPQHALAHGMCEADFAKLILQYLAQPNTCSLGYNSLRFDDEVTRNILYRNFYDPYAREWQNGNSRWDLIDVVRAASALRPDGIVWPKTEERRSSFRLEELTKANGIEHVGAHDALVDVYATIAFAKLLRKAQPKLYQFLWQHRVKTEAANLLQVGTYKPVLHVSGKYSSSQHCLAVILPICKHPTDSNGVLVYDLSIDPEPMLSLNAEEIKLRIFTANADLPEGISRIPLKTVHINRCPVLAPMSVLREPDAARLGIDLELCYKHLGAIKAEPTVVHKMVDVFSPNDLRNKNTDPDLAIYSGGFFGPQDKQVMQKIHATAQEKLAGLNLSFKDQRLPEMLFRYRARNYVTTLSEQERKQWREYCVQQLTVEKAGFLSFASYFDVLERIKERIDGELFVQLQSYATEKMKYLGLVNHYK